jgi:hypothetical protein
MEVLDYNWTLDERAAEQYSYFVLLGSKGMTQAFPTIPVKNAEQFYTRDEALAHAKLAARAPEMLRLLRLVEKSLVILSVDDAGARNLLDEVQRGLSSIVVK